MFWEKKISMILILILNSTDFVSLFCIIVFFFFFFCIAFPIRRHLSYLKKPPKLSKIRKFSCRNLRAHSLTEKLHWRYLHSLAHILFIFIIVIFVLLMKRSFNLFSLYIFISVYNTIGNTHVFGSESCRRRCSGKKE